MHPFAAASRCRLLETEPKLFVFETSYYTAAKLSLFNFLSLFRDLQKSTRFSGGGVAEFSRDLQNPTRFSGGGSSTIFPLFSVAKSHFYPTSSDIRG